MESPTLRNALHSICLAAMFASGNATADNWRELFKDPQDGRLDASRWLLERHGFLPIPLVITEPAVGYGGGVALAFFHRKDPAQGTSPISALPPDKPKLVPPSVSAVMVAATENGTKIGGLGHLGIWRDNTLRYSGGVAAMDINLTFYGDEDFPRLNDGVGYSMKGWATFQQLVWKIGPSDVWLGGQFIYLDADTGLDEDNAPPVFDSLNGKVENFGAGVVLQYDSRDNIFTPSRGLQSEWYVREHWGSFTDDFDYTELDGKNRWYLDPGSRWVVGMRLDVSFTSGDAPFYALPSINQRGIEKGRYQGDAVFATEVETRYDIDGRWFAVAFAGVGRAADSLDELDSTQSRWAGGIGARYLISRLMGLQMGIDVAKGPEEWAFYLQAGSGWSF